MSDTPTWLGEALSALLGTGLGGLAVAFAKSRKAREESATAVVPELRGMIAEMREELQGARAEVKAVLDGRERDREDYESAITSLQEDMQSAIRASDERCEEMRRQDREECRQETLDAVERATEPLRAELIRLASHASETRAAVLGPDDTGTHRLQAIADRVARRTPTPQPLPVARVELVKKTDDR